MSGVLLHLPPRPRPASPKPAPRLYTEDDLRAAKAAGYRAGVDEAMGRLAAMTHEAHRLCCGRPDLKAVTS